jgi:hypothetical protein
MTVLGGIGFAAPWLLVALAALPILWLILRAVPPAPIRRRFPGVALLLGLTDDDSVTDRTPWWLLLLRMLAVAAVILGLAGPVLNPRADDAGSGRLLIVLDATWAGAARWAETEEAIAARLGEAGRIGRPVAVLRLTQPEPPVFQSAEHWLARLPGLTPAPWAPTEALAAEITAALDTVEGGYQTLWFGDGLDYAGRTALLDAVQERGDVTVVQTGRPMVALRPAAFVDGAVELTALRPVGGQARDVTVLAQGLDPSGTARILATLPLTFEAGATEATGALSLPPELRARITRFELAGLRSAGAVTLTDDALRRREVALIAGREDREGLELLSPLHYLRQALEPSADLLDGALLDLLPANPDVIVLADVATLSDAEEDALIDWAEGGGLLLRFAGPRVAASDIARSDEHPLMPVRLRAGGRTVGGTMSWGAPKTLAPFAESSPFFGLRVPDDVAVTAQVMAQPDPTLADRVIASLSDGTPLVTRKRIGQGQVVLFHVTANAEWSSLPLSGLFVEMLERLAVSSGSRMPAADDLEGTVWTPQEVLDAFGAFENAGTLGGVDGPALVEAAIGPDLRAGLYASGDRRIARNVIGADDSLTPATWPANVPVLGLTTARETPLGGWLLALALALLAADVIASLALSGRLTRGRTTPPAAALVLIGLLVALPAGGIQAQESDDAFALAATGELALAHVLTGDRQVDELTAAGLQGLTDVLFFRTSVEPAAPIGIDLERDELAFFPMLYWPVVPDQPQPSAEAYAKLNAYLRSGGLILFDTRDADIAGFGAPPNGRKLQALAAPLDIPPLEPMPHDHVLTRTFYLLQDFPGRHSRPQRLGRGRAPRCRTDRGHAVPQPQ